jgi:hypothetical protein
VSSDTEIKKRSSFKIVEYTYDQYPIYYTNKSKSLLTSLVGRFILSKVYCKSGLTEDDMPVI